MKKYLITSALPYINGVKHLGNLAGSLLPADVYTRYLKQTGRNAVFISATDEHGTPAEIAADEAGLSVSEFCDIQHQRQKEIYESFGLEFDHFGRTSNHQNISLTQAFAKAVMRNGYAEIRPMRQIYSIDDGRFLPDRYVVGTCPKCGNSNARGDQCENCTSVLDPEDLIDPKSAISGSSNLEIRETNHLFLKLSELSDPLRAWIDENDTWPTLVKSIANKWLDEGLHDRCITRDLKWGVPTDIEGIEEKVFYVWFDAPIGYISATKEWSDKDPENRDWKEYWYNADADVEYTQFMAKDNIPFHTISFPAAEIATGEPWKKVDNLKGFNWLNYYGDKFSTSQKRGVFTSDALEILPADYWRYYLMSRSPEGSDSTFTWKDFQIVVNKDLVNVFGNFINRVTKFTESKFDSKIPSANEWSDLEVKYQDLYKNAISEYSEHLENINFRKATEALRRIWSIGNEYLAEAAPWSSIKEDKSRAETSINFAFNIMRMNCILSRPIIPFTVDKIADALNINPKGWIHNVDEELKQMAGGTIVKPIGLAFRKIEDEEVLKWENQFSGSAKYSAVRDFTPNTP